MPKNTVKSRARGRASNKVQRPARKPRIEKPNMNDDEFNAWFSALASVKACFEIHESGTPIIIMRMKTDERAILDFVSEAVGGSVSAQKSGFSQWRSASDDDSLELLVEVLDSVPMLTAKREDYKVWKKYVQMRLRGRGGREYAQPFREQLQGQRAERMAA